MDVDTLRFVPFVLEAIGRLGLEELRADLIAFPVFFSLPITQYQPTSLLEEVSAR